MLYVALNMNVAIIIPINFCSSDKKYPILFMNSFICDMNTINGVESFHNFIHGKTFLSIPLFLSEMRNEKPKSDFISPFKIVYYFKWLYPVIAHVRCTFRWAKTHLIMGIKSDMRVDLAWFNRVEYY